MGERSFAPLHIVVPCFNEELRLPSEAFIRSLELQPALHILFADDGSTDGTHALLDKIQGIAPDRVGIHRLTRNSGKGEAVRQGMFAALRQWPDAQYIGYFDADLATPLTEAFRLRDYLTPRAPFIIMGSRVQLLGTTDIRRLAHRHYFGRLFATLVSMQLGLPVYDTQCGAKLVRADQVEALFKEPFLTRWLFDVELLWRCMILVGRHDMREQAAEVPLTMWHERAGSKVNLSDAFKVPLGLSRIARYYRGRVRM